MKAAGKSAKAAWERSTDHNPEECPVCMADFDDTVQRPHTLPCGHTVCTLCVRKLMQQDRVTCPECRVSHIVPEKGQFPVSYTLEAFMRKMRDAEASSAGTGKGAAGQKEPDSLCRKMRSFLQQQETSVKAAITTCQEIQAQLDQYQTILTSWGEQQQQLEDRLQGLLDQSRSARELVQQEESRAAAKKEEVRVGEQQLHAALEALSTPATDKEAGVVVAKIFGRIGEVEQLLEEYQGSFPDANTANTVSKVREASNAALEAFQAAQAALEAFQAAQATLETDPSVTREEPRNQSYTDCTIMDTLQNIVTPSLTAEDLRSPTQPVRWLLEAGRVFGVCQVEDYRRHARISLEAFRLYLHTLKEEPLPPGATAVEMSQIVPPSPPCVVFLDLSWPGSAPQRVHIRLSPDTPRGRQALLLCTGQNGPSYAGTSFIRVGHKGEAGENVCCGGYKSNDGKGGRAALLPDLDKGEYRASGKAGVVWGWRDDPALGALFGITTRDKQEGECVGVFGEVVQGLDTVLAAAQHSPVTKVCIEDCGVVLWG